MGNGMNKIIPGLYVGNFRDSKDTEQLAKNNITHILSIHDNAAPVLPDKKYLCISVSDTPDQDLTQHFKKCSHFIHKCRTSGGSVLVHCLAGVSRSVTVTTAYIMIISDLSWEEALHTVKLGRTVASPNYGFQKQLQQFGSGTLKKEKEKFMKKYHHTAHAITQDVEYITNLRKKHFENRTGQSTSQSKNIRSLPSGASSSESPVNQSDPLYPFNTTANRNGGYFG